MDRYRERLHTKERKEKCNRIDKIEKDLIRIGKKKENKEGKKEGKKVVETEREKERERGGE